MRGVNFSRDVKTKIATSLRNKIQDDEVYFIKEDRFMDELHSLPYDTLNAAHTNNAHADRFWAVALALMKPSTQIVNAGKLLDSYI